MQNWLAVAEPGLFFGVSGNGGLPEVEPLRFGKIVFSARLAVGEPVEILSEDGEAVIAAGVVVGNEGVMAADTGDAPPTYEIKFAKQSGAEAIESFPLRRLRRPEDMSGLRPAGQVGGRCAHFDCRFRWDGRLAGRLCELPSRGDAPLTNPSRYANPLPMP